MKLVCWKKAALATVLAVALVGFAAQARAADLPLAAASPLTGVTFDDRPLLLPVQRNFQMAMLTAGSELGRNCGRMEAYGWRMSQAEQGRVNQIFNNTADRLRLLGYTITPQTLSSVSKDITLYTADRSNKHFMFLWSAGELGLVLNVCETGAAASATHRSPTASAASSVQVFQVPMDDIGRGKGDVPVRGRAAVGGFSPVGQWVGGYTCSQGYTGGTLQIEHMHGDDFDGVFKFYPSAKNPGVPEGSYTVYGQYDRDSKRILINPGKWIKRPHSYYNTVIVGSFDPTRDTFSAYFQGVGGCTSFEAHREGAAPFNAFSDVKKHKAIKAPAKKHKAVKAKKAKSDITSETLAPLSSLPAAPAAAPSLPVQDAAVTGTEKKDAAAPAGITLSAPAVAK